MRVVSKKENCDAQGNEGSVVLNKAQSNDSTHFRIAQALPLHAPEILDVMRPWNMHHVPSPEMEELDISCFFVATLGERVVGASGYTIIRPSVGKTTLMAVLPEYAGQGLGQRLHLERCKAMYQKGVKTVITNSDLPSTIRWYRKYYGYRVVGSVKKVSSFGSDEIDTWTTLEMDLESYMSNKTL